jgi:hypothetical protein
MSRHYIPIFAVIRLLTLGLAIAEAKWIFQGKSKLEATQSARILEAIAGDAVAPAVVEETPATDAVVASSLAVDEPVVEAPAASTVALTAIEVSAPVATVPVAPVPATTVPVASYSIADASEAPVPQAVAPAAPVPVAPAPAVYVPVATYSFVATPPSPSPKLTQSVGDEYEEFIQHMAQGKRPFRKPGTTVKQEFELWLAARTKASTQPPAKPSKAGGLSGLLKVSRNLD